MFLPAPMGILAIGALLSLTAACAIQDTAVFEPTKVTSTINISRSDTNAFHVSWATDKTNGAIVTHDIHEGDVVAMDASTPQATIMDRTCTDYISSVSQDTPIVSETCTGKKVTIAGLWSNSGSNGNAFIISTEQTALTLSETDKIAGVTIHLPTIYHSNLEKVVDLPVGGTAVLSSAAETVSSTASAKMDPSPYLSRVNGSADASARTGGTTGASQ